MRVLLALGRHIYILFAAWPSSSSCRATLASSTRERANLMSTFALTVAKSIDWELASAENTVDCLGLNVTHGYAGIFDASISQEG